MSSHDVQRAYVAAVLIGQAEQFDRARADMQAQLAELREEWSSNTAHQVAAHEARIRQIQEDNLAWLRSRYDDEPAPEDHELAGGQSGTPTGTHVRPAGPAPQQPDPHAADLIEAERIRTMSMQDWTMERQRLIRANQGMF